mgnify:FL=1
MAQLLVIVLISAVSVGLYRCNNAATTTASPDNSAASRLEQTLQAPRDVEKAMQDQVDAINQRNQEMLQRY